MSIMIAPFVVFGVVLVVLVLLYGFQQRLSVQRGKTYRQRYLQLVAQFEGLTYSVNQLAGFLRDVSSRELWEYYEGCLKILETLLAATVKLKPFGNEPSALDPAFFLVKDCQDRIFRTQRAFREQMRGRKVNFDELYGRRKDNQTDYCYFCSRPTILNRFSKVRVKIDGQTREAVSCPICRIELEQTKKVKVLYFLQNGKPVHWSETPDYSPSEDYWNLNKRDPKKSPKKLMLVYPAESET